MSKQLFICTGKIELAVAVYASAPTAQQAQRLADESLKTTHFASCLALRLEREFLIRVQEGKTPHFITIRVESEVLNPDLLPAREIDGQPASEVPHA
jgi:hypothetical protein